MKKLLILASMVGLVLLQSCEKKGPGDNYDFTNSLAPYVSLSSTAAKAIKQGSSGTFTFLVKTSLQQAVTVTYNVSGAVTLTNQTVTIAKDALTGTANVAIPAGTIVAPATTAVATLSLVKAVKEDGTVLTLGATNNSATQKVTINITN
ncbi:hypothetical protein [Pedobacter aquatilis]|uniref:hypothetical protein n=1 Tax=Pedobacter aquatilis TaxID=351343 RepID=UPI00292D904F|nr:hypothetical protein [Pedobacter aquatilis]